MNKKCSLVLYRNTDSSLIHITHFN